MENTKGKNTDSMYRPTGRNQYDYLLRLTQQIVSLNHNLKMGKRVR